MESINPLKLFQPLTKPEKIIFVSGIVVEVSLLALAIFASMSFEVLAVSVIVINFAKIAMINKLEATLMHRLKEKDLEILNLQRELHKLRTLN